MVERVDHGIMSATATTGWETAKGGLKAAFGVGLVGIIAGAALGALVASGVGALVGAVVVGAAAFFGAGPIAAALGTVLGFSKGMHRVHDENAAYAQRQKILSGAAVNQQNLMAQQAFVAGAQQGYAKGQQDVVSELQRVHAEMIQAEMAKQAVANKSPVGEHTAKVCNDRAAAQAAGKQMAV